MQIKMELYSLSYKLNWEKHKYDSFLCYKAMLDLWLAVISGLHCTRDMMNQPQNETTGNVSRPNTCTFEEKNPLSYREWINFPYHICIYMYITMLFFTVYFTVVHISIVVGFDKWRWNLRYLHCCGYGQSTCMVFQQFFSCRISGTVYFGHAKHLHRHF